MGSSDFRSILQRVFIERRAKNPRYSLRAFARDLMLSPSQMSLVLNGKRGLSLARAHAIVEKIGLSTEEGALFCLLVESMHARSSVERNVAQKKLTQHRNELEHEKNGLRCALRLNIAESDLESAKGRIAEFCQEFEARYGQGTTDAQTCFFRVRFSKMNDLPEG